MEHIFTSIFPVFGLILVGYFFKRISFPSHEFWPLADKLTYFVLMPSLLIIELSNAKFSADSLNFMLVVLLALFATLLVLIFLNMIFRTSNVAFTSIVQGGIRFNTYVFLALASAIFGSEGLVLSAIILTVAIPFVNVCCVSIFAFYSDNNKLGFSYLIKSIIKNPLIIACLIGATINLSGLALPISLENLLKILSKAALPLGLLSIGYALVIRELNSSKRDLLISSVAKFIVLPFFMYILAQGFALDPLMQAVLVLFGIMPTAPSAFILARQLGGHLPLMTSIITMQTLVAVVWIILFLKFII
ncbi:AEC family transporter [Gallibacterium salpingitidis]|uniref:Transporter n=1 Tax=Gallibacterium salpingitidis TaxID=505341 RepID=A0A1A7NXF6_9PAST|nr:AEC family transporter [Gallibacterium salpingitidis]OBW94270.1 transporter [Gallibacterium salpingitidis]